MNKVIISGRLCTDVELKYTNSKVPVTEVSVAVNRQYVKKDEERKADFLQVVFWNKQAEFVSKYFKKGSYIIVSGRLETGYYDDKDGKRVYTTKIIAEEIDFGGSTKKEENTQAQGDFNAVTDDMLPF